MGEEVVRGEGKEGRTEKEEWHIESRPPFLTILMK